MSNEGRGLTEGDYIAFPACTFALGPPFFLPFPPLIPAPFFEYGRAGGGGGGRPPPKAL